MFNFLKRLLKNYRHMFVVDNMCDIKTLRLVDNSIINSKNALDISITKWTIICEWLKKQTDARVFFDDGCRDTCALCQLYVDDACEACPVKRCTGRAFCRTTPYDKYVTAECRESKSQMLEAANEELEFLRSLK